MFVPVAGDCHTAKLKQPLGSAVLPVEMFPCHFEVSEEALYWLMERANFLLRQ